MRTSILLILSLFVTGCSSAPTTDHAAEKQPHFWETVHAQSFYRGDVRVRLETNAKPYLTSGYQFVVLEKPKREKKPATDFAILEGSELASNPSNGGAKISVSALCAKPGAPISTVNTSVSQILAAQIASVRAAGGVAVINHPNRDWAIGPSDLLSVDNFEMLEIATGDPAAHDAGDGSHPSVEELWDRFMTEKHKIYGIATNGLAHPGAASLSVWATELSESAICEALRQGHFYAARGSKITALVVSPKTLELAISDWKATEDHVDFMGAGGRLLQTTFETPARYVLRGGEGYVRAHVFQKRDADHREAWTQAYYIKRD